MKSGIYASLAALAVAGAVLTPGSTTHAGSATGSYETRTKHKVKVDGFGSNTLKFTEKFRVKRSAAVGSVKYSGRQSGDADGDGFGDRVKLQVKFKIKFNGPVDSGKRLKTSGKIIDKGKNLDTGDKLVNRFKIKNGFFKVKTNRRGDAQYKGKTKAQGNAKLGNNQRADTTLISTFRGKG
jgi:hypothetical protein